MYTDMYMYRDVLYIHIYINFIYTYICICMCTYIAHASPIPPRPLAAYRACGLLVVCLDALGGLCGVLGRALMSCAWFLAGA